jgi:EAL domain-containing protein (putative c-di-GMP-specific phosphodiesterase class I)
MAAAAAVLAYPYLNELAVALSAAALSVAFALALIVHLGERAVARGLAEIQRLKGETRRLGLSLDRLDRRIEELEERVAEPGPQPPLAAEIEELKGKLRRFAAAHDTAPPPRPRSLVPRAQPLDHTLDLYLEPIVALATGRTEHYRASIVLAAPDGKHVPSAELARRLRNHSLRPALDIHCLTRVLPLTQKLAWKRPNLLILVPIGAETLAHADSIAALAQLLHCEEGAVSRLAFEIEHQAMACLTSAGIGGLAALARHGAVMALVEPSPGAVDLKALRDLRFGFLSFPAASLPRTSFGKPEWSGLAELAAAQGFTIEVRGLAASEDADCAKRWAKLGSGRAFAPPRRVRTDATAASAISDAA